MMYYQQQPMYYAPRRQYPVHQQAMLVHYGQQYRSRSSPSGEIAAFAAGESIGAGSYLQGTHRLKNINIFYWTYLLIYKYIL